MDKKALFNIASGLYILATSGASGRAACVINTVVQVTETPLRLVVAVNKNTATHDAIVAAGGFTLSVLDQTATFDTIRHFGFQSSRDVDKFAESPAGVQEVDGMPALAAQSNAVIACRVVSVTDLGTHSLILADVTDARILSDKKTLTYDDYQKNVKPKPQTPASKKTVWRCEICGFEIEADELSPEYLCPWCGHGIDAFVKVSG